MKLFSTFLFIVVLLIILPNQTIAQRPQDSDELGRLVFKSFQNEDYNAFEHLIFTDDDCRIMSSDAIATDSSKAIVVKQRIGLTKKIRRLSNENFNEIISKGKQKNRDWSQSELLKVFFEIEEDHNIKTCDILLFCKNKDLIFGIRLDNCSKSDAWLMMGTVAIQFKNG